MVKDNLLGNPLFFLFFIYAILVKECERIYYPVCIYVFARQNTGIVIFHHINTFTVVFRDKHYSF